MKTIFIITLIALSVLINLFSFNKVQDWGDDFAGYIIQAKTIHTGSYSDLEANIKKNDFILNYPWGFPFLIAPLITYFDNNIIIIKIYIYLFFVAGMVIVFYLFREHIETALLTVLFISSSPYFWEFKNYILADIPNLFFVLLALFFSDRFLIKRKMFINEYFACTIIGVLVYISYMMRNQSIVLLPTVILVQIIIFRSELFSVRKMLMLFIPVVVFLILLSTSSALIPVKPVTYLDQYAHLQFGKTVWENIFYYISVWKELFATTLVINKIATVFTGFFIIFVFIGAFTTVQKNILFILFFGLSIILVLISPFHQGLRYLIPLIPFFFYFFITGFRYSVFHVVTANKIKYLVYYSVIGFIILVSIKTIFVYSRETLKNQVEWEGPYKKTSIEMFGYIRNNTPAGGIIGFCKPRAMLLYTGRNSVVARSYDECISKKIGYLVYYKNTATEQLPLDSVNRHSATFPEVFRNADFIVFKARTSGF